MKDSLDSAAVGRALEPRPAEAAHSEVQPENGGPARDGFVNRKLIRPSLQSRAERSERTARGESNQERAEVRTERSLLPGRKAAPPDQTHAENFYFQKQMQSKTPMVVLLNDGEEIRGVIEWYDKDCIKLNRTGSHPNLLIYKSNIKYLFKESESNGRR